MYRANWKSSDEEQIGAHKHSGGLGGEESSSDYGFQVISASAQVGGALCLATSLYDDAEFHDYSALAPCLYDMHKVSCAGCTRS